jgi:hypothetical protein
VFKCNHESYIREEGPLIFGHALALTVAAKDEIIAPQEIKDLHFEPYVYTGQNYRSVFSNYDIDLVLCGSEISRRQFGVYERTHVTKFRSPNSPLWSTACESFSLEFTLINDAYVRNKILDFLVFFASNIHTLSYRLNSVTLVWPPDRGVSKAEIWIFLGH